MRFDLIRNDEVRSEHMEIANNVRGLAVTKGSATPNRPLHALLDAQPTTVNDLEPPDMHDIWQVYEHISKKREMFGGHTKMIQDSPLLCELSGGVKIFLALENKQPTRSYKIRGVFAELMAHSPEVLSKGILTASSGNHGAATAYIAKKLGVPCAIVVPTVVSDSKVRVIEAYGGMIIRHGSTYDDAYQYAQQVAKERNSTFIDVSSRLAVAGQGTLALEMLEQVPDADAVLLPVGGGALLAGMAIAVKEVARMRKREILVIGVEPEGAACCYESLKAGKLVTLEYCETIADGLRVQTPDAHLFPILQNLVDEIVTVPEKSIGWGMGLLAGICESLVEGAAVLGPMALLSSKGVLKGVRGKEIDLRGKKVVTPLTGGNVDLSTLEKLIAN